MTLNLCLYFTFVGGGVVITGGDQELLLLVVWDHLKYKGSNLSWISARQMPSPFLWPLDLILYFFHIF